LDDGFVPEEPVRLKKRSTKQLNRRQCIDKNFATGNQADWECDKYLPTLQQPVFLDRANGITRDDDKYSVYYTGFSDEEVGQFGILANWIKIRMRWYINDVLKGEYTREVWYWYWDVFDTSHSRNTW
jgi:hypothetical protein